jgi:hypothetical protein
VARGDRIGRSVIPRADYHGAHKTTVDAPARDRWEDERCVAFVHDIFVSPELPNEYAVCDVLVADLPWRRGYETFNQRAGVQDGRTYSQFMARVASFAETTEAPLWLITGQHALRHLPKPDAVLPTRLNEDDAIAIGYRPGPETDGTYGLAQEFLRALALRYTVVGDFCCGYGRSGKAFLRAGKRAVLSDFNPRCIGYIAQHAPDWILAERRATQQMAAERIAGQQERLNIWSRTVDGLTTALALARDFKPPPSVPDNYVSVAEFKNRLISLREIVDQWETE